ncbi:MAG: hypothetical protein M1824_003168 [Vezdaea acicularis]|nr:MAG: hypothetical protein M1824_003168 [Vezdaea acicularis]
MSQPSTQPSLNPQFCFSSGALQGKFGPLFKESGLVSTICVHIAPINAAADMSMTEEFLRISRSTIDDSITQNLNALVTPSRLGFDPTSTSVRQSRRPRELGQEACEAFKNKILFPSWKTRSDVLEYCASVAASDDPDDPEAIARQIEAAKDKERVIDERTDPYSARFFPKEPRTEVLANIVRNETSIESIVRSRTWGLVVERCGRGKSDSLEGAMENWRLRYTKPR